MKIETFVTNRMVKGEDLNHHGTLFAGRSAQWFVEAGFIAAANLTSPESTLCLKIHGMLFKKPVNMGSVIRFESKIVHAGRTSLVAHVRLFFSQNDEFLLEGFITFIHVGENGRPTPHNITIEAVDPEDVELQERAKALHP
jgi:acyl-CoA hydrolase